MCVCSLCAYVMCVLFVYVSVLCMCICVCGCTYFYVQGFDFIIMWLLWKDVLLWYHATRQS